jgi:hypothetical protein
MRIYTALQIGEYHTNHCEDYLFAGDIGEDKILCAVMDGCTMGTDSYFASTLVGKLLRKIAQEKSYKELYGLEDHPDLDIYLKSILQELFRELKIIESQLMLSSNELLTTLIILLVDKKTNEGIVLAIGDGLVSINGTVTEYDQDNKPDYIGFHLNEPFDEWYHSQTQKIAFNSINDISIATDGIFLFKPVRHIDVNDEIDPIGFLVADRSNEQEDDMLELKLKRLEHRHYLKPMDDFAMIRLIKLPLSNEQ